MSRELISDICRLSGSFWPDQTAPEILDAFNADDTTPDAMPTADVAESKKKDEVDDR